MREPMDKNPMRGLRCCANWHVTVKRISIKSTGGKSGGCAQKAFEFTLGDLLVVAESQLRDARAALTDQ